MVDIVCPLVHVPVGRRAQEWQEVECEVVMAVDEPGQDEMTGKLQHALAPADRQPPTHFSDDTPSNPNVARVLTRPRPPPDVAQQNIHTGRSIGFLARSTNATACPSWLGSLSASIAIPCRANASA